MDLTLEIVEKKLAEAFATRNDLVLQVNMLNGAINVLESIRAQILAPKPEAVPEPEPSRIIPA